MVVVQLEIAVESSLKALQLAKKHSVKSIFNVAPGVKDLPREMLTITDILCLNETEASCLCYFLKLKWEKINYGDPLKY